MIASDVNPPLLFPLYENIIVPNYKPCVKNIVSCTFSPMLAASHFIEELEGHSYENTILTGATILMLIKYIGTLTYCTQGASNQLYPLHITFYKSCIINLPTSLGGASTAFLHETHALPFTLTIGDYHLSLQSPCHLRLSFIQSIDYPSY